MTAGAAGRPTWPATTSQWPSPRSHQPLTGGADTKNGGVSRFTSADEDGVIADPNNDDPFVFAEWGGDIVFQQQLGVIRPRPVSRFQGVVREPSRTTAPSAVTSWSTRCP